MYKGISAPPFPSLPMTVPTTLAATINFKRSGSPPGVHSNASHSSFSCGGTVSRTRNRHPFHRGTVANAATRLSTRDDRKPLRELQLALSCLALPVPPSEAGSPIPSPRLPLSQPSSRRFGDHRSGLPTWNSTKNLGKPPSHLTTSTLITVPGLLRERAPAQPRGSAHGTGHDKRGLSTLQLEATLLRPRRQSSAGPTHEAQTLRPLACKDLRPEIVSSLRTTSIRPY